MSRQLVYLIIMSVSLLFILSCKHPYGDLSDNVTPIGDTSTPCDATRIYFQQQVLPILVSNCAMSGVWNGKCLEGSDRRKSIQDAG